MTTSPASAAPSAKALAHSAAKSPAKAAPRTKAPAKAAAPKPTAKVAPTKKTPQARTAGTKTALPKTTAPKTAVSKTVQVVSRTAAPAKPKSPAVLADKGKAPKEKKVKVVRDSFTIPKTEFNQIGESKIRAMKLGIAAKKSEIIRAGLRLMQGLSDANFKIALAAVPTVKTGRPAKD